MKKEIEIRSISTEIRQLEPESRTIHGLAIPTESRSALLHDMLTNRDFYETISNDAVNDELIASQDIKLYINHDSSQGTYGRSKFGEGSLRLFVTERGLEFEVEMPNTVFGDAVLEGIRRGDIDAVSFAFIPEKQSWSNNGDGTYDRMIRSINFLDEISILSCLPAYNATNVNCRSLEQFTKEEQEKILQSLDDRMNEIYKITEGLLPDNK